MPFFWVHYRHAGGPERNSLQEGASEQAVLEALGPVPAGTSILSVSSVTDYPTCLSCPWAAQCHDSVWNEMGGGKKLTTEITSVHTCKSCGQQVFSSFGEDIQKVAPAGCPRWSPTAGSAIDCGKCRADRESFRAKNPRLVKRKRLMMKAFENVISGQKPDEVFPALAELELPQLQTDPTATRVLAVLLHEMFLIEQLWFAWHELESDRQMISQMEWLEAFMLVVRSEGVERAVQSVFLEMTDLPRLGTAWARLPVEERARIHHRVLKTARQQVSLSAEC